MAESALQQASDGRSDGQQQRRVDDADADWREARRVRAVQSVRSVQLRNRKQQARPGQCGRGVGGGTRTCAWTGNTVADTHVMSEPTV